MKLNQVIRFQQNMDPKFPAMLTVNINLMIVEL